MPPNDNQPQDPTTSPLVADRCHCGGAALVTVDHAGYCRDHLDDALLAIERIRLELGAPR